MKTLKGICQIILALVCLVAAGLFCVALVIARPVVWLFELGDQFFREAFNTELFNFFRSTTQGKATQDEP